MVHPEIITATAKIILALFISVFLSNHFLFIKTLEISSSGFQTENRKKTGADVIKRKLSGQKSITFTNN
jgi:hypothetical protein